MSSSFGSPRGHSLPDGDIGANCLARAAKGAWLPEKVAQPRGNLGFALEQLNDTLPAGVGEFEPVLLGRDPVISTTRAH
jgi:hypothetical protein